MDIWITKQAPSVKKVRIGTLKVRIGTLKVRVGTLRNCFGPKMAKNDFFQGGGVDCLRREPRPKRTGRLMRGGHYLNLR